jgi:hypothetical protein
MKNVTITLPESVLQRARVAAANQNKSLSKFISDLVIRHVGYDPEEILRGLSKYIDGPGFPGIAKDWPTREEIYADREEQLLRRHQRSGLSARSEGQDETSSRDELAEKDRQESYVGSEPAKSK